MLNFVKNSDTLFLALNGACPIWGEPFGIKFFAKQIKYLEGYTSMKLKPLADRVVLKQNAAEERTSSGIYLTSSAQEKPEIYEVVEVGPGGFVEGNEVKMIVKAGQNVLVGKYSGTKVKLDEEEYTIVRQSDILAVIE